MASLGVSPTAPSLLIPPNPSYTSAENTPKGGILLNPRRGSDASAPTSPAFLSISLDPASPPARRTSEPPDSPRTPISPIESTIPILQSFPSSGSIPKIRFAPLPDPRRPRSLSTGQDVPETVHEEGPATRTYEIRDVSKVEYEDDEALADADAGDISEYEEDGEKKRRWSKSMSMGMGTMPGWRGTKKLLGMKEDKKGDGYTEGAPLTKSVSTGSSPFRSTAESERKRSMQGLSSSFSGSSLSAKQDVGHRRNSSLEPTPGGGLGSSPQPVRMLNGRVYGSRRASEAAERQKEIQRKQEPNFVEWGNGVSAGSTSSSGRGFLGDNEDGSGMEWVKKRREERQRKQQAEREAAAASTASAGSSYTDPSSVDPLSSSSSASNSPDIPTKLITPNDTASPLPPTPIIQVSEHQSPSAEKTMSMAMGQDGRLGSSAPDKLDHDMRHHVTQAIQVPQRSEQGGRDVFDDNEAISDGEDEEEEEDNDFSEDDEEEEDIRNTSAAAGVEVVSRHKN